MPDRLSLLAHYLIWKCNPADLGATKLNKILWFADVEHYRLTGKSISGADAYTKLQFGPVPQGMMPALNSLRNAGKIAIQREPNVQFPKTMFMSLERPDISSLTADEVAILDSFADIICREYTAKSISKESHDALWEETAMGAPLPIGAAAMLPGEVSVDDLKWVEGALAN